MPEPEYCYLDGYFVNYSDPHDPGAWQFTPFRSEDHRTYRIKIKVPDELRAVELTTSVAAAAKDDAVDPGSPGEIGGAQV